MGKFRVNISETIQNGNDLLLQGIEMGNKIPLGKNRFVEESGYSSYAEYKRECVTQKKIIWQILIGLASLDEELEAINAIYDFSVRTGLEIWTVQPIPSQLVGLPKEYRKDAPAGTSYILEKEEDWIAHTKVAPMQIIFEDQHLSCPNSLETTINALKSGSARIGIFAQFIWDYAGFNDDIKRYSDMVKSIGIIASKKEEYIMIDSYLDDGLPGFSFDCITYIGYAMLEHYICTVLCGARYSVSYGGLLPEGETRAAVGMAIDKALSTPEQPVLSYINGSTLLQWDHDIAANYGTSVQEMLLEILVERKYQMGMAINPVAISENIGIASLQDMLDILAAGKRTEEKASEWENIMDFTHLENMRDDMVEKGRNFYENVLNSFSSAGINITDPLQMLLAIKSINPSKFESYFHPNTNESGEVIPYYPTTLGRITLKEAQEILVGLLENGYNNSLAGKKIFVASGDGHSYALMLVESVLQSLGANVVNGGVGKDPQTVLNIATKENCNIIGISVHNGQALDYGTQIIGLINKLDIQPFIFMGGRLNSILPGDSIASNVTDKLIKMGICATNNLAESVEKICELD